MGLMPTQSQQPTSSARASSQKHEDQGRARQYEDFRKVRLILTCLAGVTLNLMSAKPKKLGSCECRELRSPLNTHLYVGHFYRIRSRPSRKMMAHNEPGEKSPQESDSM
jgi:hypothetical protein